MLRISHTSTSETPIALRLEGEIRDRWVEELRRECVRALEHTAQDGIRLVLDLAGVSSIDGDGLALFRELRTRRILVRNCSLYVAALLEGVVEVDA